MKDLSQEETLQTPRRDEGLEARIGPYRILQQIGEGAFGTVLEADQEHPVKRRVALKILKLGMDTQQVVARFEAERQALAIMDHPHIAKVFDAGATEDGRPYFVMELVKGEPITAYCDRHNLSIIDRVKLFDQVCVAVQHAHMKGIIHRDLKPSNVLVSTHDDLPFAKVIDFGIAKATSIRLTETPHFTALHEIVGTPLYMSPEQIQGSADIDTRTDIYSLGVMLYELLTGTTPVAPETLGQGLLEVQRVIREVTPPRPSARLSQSASTLAEAAARRGTQPGALRGMVRGDLDWIVLKAIEKERVRRYETANALAMDLRRCLAGEPVLAVPPSASYRLRKFVRRHKAAVGAGLLVATTLVLGIIGTTVGLVRAERQRQAAEQVASFMKDILGGVAPSVARGRDTVMMKEMMARAADRIEKGELAGAPEAEIELRRSIGGTLTHLAEFASADRMLKAALEKARERYGHEDPHVAEALSELAYLRREQAEYAEAEALHREALRIMRARLGPRSSEVAQALGDLATVLAAESRIDEADAAFRESLVMYRELGKTETRNFIVILGSYAVMLRRANRLAEAEEAYREAFATARRVLGDQDSDLAVLQSNLTNVLRNQGKYPEAETMAREALTRLRSVFGDAHPSVAGGLATLAASLLGQGRYAEAEPPYREALATMRKAAGNNHINVARALRGLAAALVGQGKFGEAEPLAREAVAIADRAWPNSDDAMRTRVILGRALTGMGRFPQAESVRLEAEGLLPVAPAITPAWRSDCLRALIEMYSGWEKASPGRGHAVKAGERSRTLDDLIAANPALVADP